MPSQPPWWNNRLLVVLRAVNEMCDTDLASVSVEEIAERTGRSEADVRDATDSLVEWQLLRRTRSATLRPPRETVADPEDRDEPKDDPTGQ